MRASKNTCCIGSLLLYFGRPYIVTDYNKERTVWYLCEYIGLERNIRFFRTYRINSDIEIPLCEVEKLDVIYHDGWVNDYSIKIPEKIYIVVGFSHTSPTSDVAEVKFKVVKNYREVFFGN